MKIKHIVKKKVVEAFSTDTVGNVQFAKTQLTDKHVQYIIQQVAKVIQATPKQVEEEILAKIKRIQEFKEYAPILYSTMAENAIESEIFRLVQKHGIRNNKSSEFDIVVFNKLVSYIKAEHHEFFPLKDFKTHKGLREAYIFVPNPYDKTYNKVDTAAATRDGTFIFNLKFMQHLIDYANIKGIKPTSTKYESNGGPIPDDYCFIEFLIMHEYMHYTFADWDVSDRHKVSAKISNWAGDFRSNYMLVKHGLHQLPIGLFSKDINYDKQSTFKRMAQIVKEEMDKLPKHLRDEAEIWLEEHEDEHSSNGDSEGETIDKIEIEVGTLVKAKNGKYGVVVSIDNKTKKAVIRDLTKQELDALNARMSKAKKI